MTRHEDIAGLHFCAMGQGDGTPIILLHGFGSDAASWEYIQKQLAKKRTVIAFDLPGHGNSVSYPAVCDARVAAGAILEAMDGLHLKRAHIVGHSLGGATACLIALLASDRVSSLTLLAPGGFGPEINTTLLKHYASVGDADQMHILLEQFYGWEFDLPRSVSQEAFEFRAKDGRIAALIKIADRIFKERIQKTLPIDKLVALELPVKVIWGTQDRILPTRQCHKLPGEIATHVFARVGHMVHKEIPQQVVRLIEENCAFDR